MILYSSGCIIGSLIQVPEGKGRFRRRLSSFNREREAVRQCFLFSNYMIIANRYETLKLFKLINGIGMI